MKNIVKPLHPEFWKGRRVLVTGHTGFKGSWMTLCLQSMGAAPIGVALPPQADPNLYTSAEVERCCRSHFCDVREEALLSEIVKEASPEVVFHLAAQPLVRYSYGHPVDTFSTNVMGTVHLLNILRDVETVRVVVVITTDKVYRNNEGFWAYRETDPLGGQDPYSASKSCCEMVVDSYRRSFLEERGVAVATARAGNVIGGGDWSEDRIIPDIVRAWRSGTVLKVRHPEAIRPWQHVLEPIYGYLTLAEKLWDTSSLAGAYNFGPSPYHSATVEKVLSLVQRDHRSLSVQVEFEESLLHESGTLLLDPSKAKMMLGVEPVWSLEEMFERTFSWYESYYKGEHAKELCLADIEALGVFG